MAAGAPPGAGQGRERHPADSGLEGSLDADAALLEQAVREAGGIAMRFFRKDPRRWDKGEDNPVSEADIAIDRQLREALAGPRPHYGWLSEESADDKSRLDRRAVWIVDPIDGTRAFLEGRPQFSISVALVLDGVPVLAAVYAPAVGELYQAAAGRGATLNGRPIRVSARPDLRGARILTTRSVFNRMRKLADLPEAESHYRNSIAYRLALTASGSFDASITLSEKSEWDVAAGDLIVREAGGLVSDAWGGDLPYNQPLPVHRTLIAAAPQLHAPLLHAAGLEMERRRLSPHDED